LENKGEKGTFSPKVGPFEFDRCGSGFGGQERGCPPLSGDDEGRGRWWVIKGGGGGSFLQKRGSFVNCKGGTVGPSACLSGRGHFRRGSTSIVLPGGGVIGGRKGRGGGSHERGWDVGFSPSREVFSSYEAGVL